MAEHFALPVTNPVVVFAIVMLILLVAPLVFARLRVPGIVGLIISGVIVGPHALGVLERGETMELLGMVGLLYIMFIAGLEIDLNEFSRYRKRSMIFGAITYGLPQLIGAALAAILLGMSPAAAVLFGSIIASHTLVAYPIVSRLGLAQNQPVTTAVGATIITDSAALLVLAVVAGSAEGDINMAFALRLGGSLAVYVAAVFVIVPRIGKWFFRNLEESSGETEFVFVLAVVFTVAFLAEVAGVEPIIGAFLAGLALNRLVPKRSTLMNRIAFVGESLFIPFFLLSVGMLVDVAALFVNPDAWLVAGIMLAVVVGTKWVAAFSTRWLFGFSSDDAWMIFGLTVAQAAATLAAVLIGIRIGLLSEEVLNGTILMILVTCLIGPWVSERYGRRVALAEAEKPYEPSEAPERILVPVIDVEKAAGLVELAMLIRDPRSEQAIYPLTVAGEGVNVQEKVALSQKLLENVAGTGTAADIPVVPITRVDADVAGGIQRAITEESITTVVMGWDGNSAARGVMFGGVLDRLLKETRGMALVCRTLAPLNTMSRILWTVPPFADREPGFATAMRLVKTLASQLGGRLVVMALPDMETSLKNRLDALKPEVKTEWTSVERWDRLLPSLDSTISPNDLLVMMTVREGALAWRPGLNRLPRVVSQRFRDTSQIYLFPSEVPPRAAPAADRPNGETESSPFNFCEKMQVHLSASGASWEEVLTRILVQTSDTSWSRLEGTVQALTDFRSGYAPECGRGTALLHAHVPGLQEPQLHVAVSRDGLKLAATSGPVYLLVVLLNPEEPEDTAYLERLTETAALLRDEDLAQALRYAASPEEVRRALTEGASLASG